MQESDCPAISDDGSLEGTSMGRWYEKMVEGASVLGKDLGTPKGYKSWMEEVGFESVEERIFYWPIGVGITLFCVASALLTIAVSLSPAFVVGILK